MKNKKIFITGGAGFIGSTLAFKLCQDNEIVIFDNLHRDAITGSGLLEKPNIQFVKGDVLDYNALKETIAGSTHVIHMAAIAGVDTVMKNPVLTMKVSILGTINVLNAAYELNHIEKFIDFSTSEVFGRYAYKVREGDTSQLGTVGEARWTYAVSKLATEHLALNYYKQFKFPAVSIRPFNIFGPAQVGEGAIHHFIVRALKNEDIIIHNDGSQIRSWCYIDDIIDGICLVLTNEKSNGEAFNIGNPRSTLTIYNLAKKIIRLSGSKSKIKFMEWNYPDVELRIPDIDKAKVLLGYQPAVDLEEGLLKTIDWYRKKIN